LEPLQHSFPGIPAEQRKIELNQNFLANKARRFTGAKKRTMHLAIIGLPNSTKTTIFNALTRGNQDTARYSSGMLDVHSATVDVPDPRVDRLVEMFHPRKTTLAQVTYSDIAGLDKGVGAGGLSGPVLNLLSQSDALVHVVRAFEDPEIPHSLGAIDPVRDISILDSELLLSDLILVERRQERLQAQIKKGGSAEEKAQSKRELELFNKLHDQLEAEHPLRDLELTLDQKKLLRNYGLLTLKPVLILLNVGDETDVQMDSLLADYDHRQTLFAQLQGRLEMELSQMSAEDAAEFLPEYGIEEPGLNRVIRLSYGLLGLQSFFTVGEDEVRAWTIPTGAPAVQAAGVIHTDLARGFIRAEVVGYQALVDAGGLAAARKAGLVRLEGKDYVVQDGDILNIRFNV
jgi:GTP-binding protein YchF